MEDGKKENDTVKTEQKVRQDLVKMEFMLSEKGKRLLVYEGCKFYKVYKTKDGLKWRCIKRKCSAKLFTDESSSVILKECLNHNHGPEETIKRQAISNSVKRKAVKEMDERPRKLIWKEIAAAPSGFIDDLNVHDILRIKKYISSARRTNFPPLLESIKKVHVALSSLDNPPKQKSGED